MSLYEVDVVLGAHIEHRWRRLKKVANYSKTTERSFLIRNLHSEIIRSKQIRKLSAKIKNKNKKGIKYIFWKLPGIAKNEYKTSNNVVFASAVDTALRHTRVE